LARKKKKKRGDLCGHKRDSRAAQKEQIIFVRKGGKRRLLRGKEKKGLGQRKKKKEGTTPRRGGRAPLQGEKGILFRKGKGKSMIDQRQGTAATGPAKRGLDEERIDAVRGAYFPGKGP